MTTPADKFSFKTFLLLIAAGVISTLIMDLAGGAFRASGLTAGVPPDLTGKWIESSMKGIVFVEDIRTSPGEPIAIGRFLVYHYLIGIMLAILFYFIISMFRIKPVAWWVPVIYGLATTLIPGLIMFPGMGFGIMGQNGPEEYLLMRTALINHLFYGIGLMIAFRWLIKNSVTFSKAVPVGVTG